MSAGRSLRAEALTDGYDHQQASSIRGAMLFMQHPAATTAQRKAGARSADDFGFRSRFRLTEAQLESVVRVLLARNSSTILCRAGRWWPCSHVGSSCEGD